MEIPELFYVETPRDLLALTGRDRASFLQGMVTNDVLGLEPGQGCYAFHLDATGHVLADMRVLVQEDRILLDLEPGVGPVLAELLDHYLVMERVKIAAPVSSSFFLGGAGAAEALESLAATGVGSWPEAAHGALAIGDSEAFPTFATVTILIQNFGATIHADPSDVAAIRRYLDASGAVRTEASMPESLRIFAGVPRFGADIDKRVLAPETGQAARAIHYKKGCYVGQEIVARIDARGHTNRALAGFWLNEPVPAETPVTVDGKEVGRITSSAAWEGMAVALGYLRNEFAAPGTTILAGDVSGTVRELS
jgi:folate-binding protein YgfZ